MQFGPFLSIENNAEAVAGCLVLDRLSSVDSFELTAHLSLAVISSFSASSKLSKLYVSSFFCLDIMSRMSSGSLLSKIGTMSLP